MAPAPQPGRFRPVLKAAARVAAWLAAVAVVSAASAYGVFEWRIRNEQQATAELRADLRRGYDELAAKTARVEEKLVLVEERAALVEEAAESAKLLMSQSGETITLEARLRGIDTLKLELQQTRQDLEGKIKAMEISIIDQVAQQGKDTAQALSVELRWKSLLIKAQGEVLLAQVYWAEGNRGMARDELGIAAASLRQGLELAPEQGREPLSRAVELAEQARGALILEQSSARDLLNLLWHRVSDLLLPPK